MKFPLEGCTMFYPPSPLPASLLLSFLNSFLSSFLEEGKGRSGGRGRRGELAKNGEGGMKRDLEPRGLPSGTRTISMHYFIL